MNDEGIVVAKTTDIPEGEAIVVDSSITGTLDNIAIFNDGGEFFALDDTCSHEDASLADGWVEDGVVECPLHAGKFCLSNGEVLSMPATKNVACHQLIVDDDTLRVIPNPERLAK